MSPSEPTVTLRMRLDRSLFRWGFLALVLAGAVPELSSENMTLTTYYPAPSGVYTTLVTTGNTYLAVTGNNVGIATTAPANKLSVNGAARFQGNLYKSNTTQTTIATYALSSRITCTDRAWAGTAAASCVAGEYASYVPGVLSEFPSNLIGTNAASYGRVVCCTCPASSFGTGVNNCP